jgi:hypothetical protein
VNREFRFERKGLNKILVTGEGVNALGMATAQAVVGVIGTEKTLFIPNDELTAATGNQLTKSAIQDIRNRAGLDYLQGVRGIRIPRS